MTTLPLVSAILPSFNAARFLQATLASIDAQTYPALEIVAGDDCSTDGTADILRDWASGRPNVTLILRDKNLGWVENCNDLMRRAKGDYMFFAFHDDLIAPDYVECLAQALRSDPEVVLAYGKMQRIEKDGSVQLRDGLGSGLQPTAFARARAMINGSSQWGVPNHGLFRASAFHRIGGMKRHDAGEFGADFPWLLHMMLIGRFALIDKPLCTKQMLMDNLSKAWVRDAASFAARDRSAMREIAASELPAWQKWWLCFAIKRRRRGRN